MFKSLNLGAIKQKIGRLLANLWRKDDTSRPSEAQKQVKTTAKRSAMSNDDFLRLCWLCDAVKVE